MNDHHHVAFIHTSNYITPPSDRVHIVSILKIAYGSNGNQGDRTGYGKASKLGYINEKLVYGYTFSELPAESAGMSQRHVIHCSENMCFS